MSVDPDVKLMLMEIRRAVEEGDFDLTAWEDEFIESVSARIEGGVDLTDRQDEILVKIWSRASK